MTDNINILYLEDDIPLANLVKRKLQRQGYTISLSPDGLDCLTQAMQRDFDVLIVDYNTPHLNGLEVLQALQEKEQLPLSIMVSGNQDLAIVVEAMKLGCSDYVIKEIDNYIDLLLVGIEKVLEKKRLMTEKEQVQKELIKSNKNLQRAQKIARVGSWEYYPKSNKLIWSEQEYYNFNCPLDEPLSNESYSRYIHPDDKIRVQTANKACLKNKQALDINFRLLLENGEIRHLQTQTELDVDSLGEIQRIFGVTKDISEDVYMDSKLKQAATVINNTAEAILISDENNSIISVNPAYSLITGYTEDEVIGKNPNIIQSGRHDIIFYEQLWEELLSTGRWQGEVWNRHKEGGIFPVWQSITAIKDISGKVVQFVSIFNDISARKASEELIHYQANYDNLTDLPNRNLFLDRISRTLKIAQREQSQFALLMLDLDRFKWVNDTLGHNAGDLMLQETAKRLLASVRESDTVARLGGDEFCIIVAQLQTPNDVEMIANKIFASFKEPLNLSGHEVFISGSVGITLYPDDGTDIETLQMNADSAMYSAKEHGRNRFHYFTPVLQEKADRHFLLVSLLQKAIIGNELSVYYQPIIDCKCSKIVSAEALLRWQQPKLGFISPEEFIPLAEESGLIRSIGNWVVQRVAEDMQRWQEAGLPKINVSINKSAHQFSVDSCEQDWLTIFNAHTVDITRITVEITETVFMEKGRDCTSNLAAMQKQGMRISLDDFGTGYSSLSYLKRFPVDILKIDRSFIRDINNDPSDAMLVEMILSLAEKMQIKVVAEGVETAEQLAFLKQRNCDYIQGYFYSKPLEIKEFEKFLQKTL